MLNAITEKKQRLLELLDRGMVMVHLDARGTMVAVPEEHKENAALALNLSYQFYIEDFRVDDEGISASLSFEGQPCPCILPWAAIFAMRSHVDDTLHVWAEDVPQELFARAGRILEEAEQARKQAGAVVEQAGSAEPSGDAGGRATSVPYLRVVK